MFIFQNLKCLKVQLYAFHNVHVILNMTFYLKFYGQSDLTILLTCGQGEALGKSQKGLIEPIQAEGNVGNAGLGWPQGRSKLHRNIMHLHQ